MSGKFINNPNVWAPQVRPAPGGRSNLDSKDKAATTTANTKVYFWYFGSASTESSIPSYSQNMPCVHDADRTGAESLVNSVDGRTQVDLKDYQGTDGRFRAIVKLFLLYDKQLDNAKEDEAAWAMATGWLVAGDIVVTAGHCAYDHSRGLGRLIKVKAYVGYTGIASVASDAVEFRYGTAVATTEGWINTDGGDEPRDVSFIKLSSSFTTVSKYYTWEQTPISQKAADLGVVGYPGDIVNDKGERGATMYTMFKRTDYNLETSSLHMLQYQIDTYGGNSGSPVFGDSNSLAVIGVHVLGGYAFNSASVITGPYGNRFQAYTSVTKSLDGTTPSGAEQPDKDKRPWLWMSHAITTESDDDDPVKTGLRTTIAQAQTVDADIPKTILNSDESISFGSDAGPQIGILASAAIAAAGRLAADSVTGSNAESVAKTRPYDGILGRAILAEAALQCFMESPSTTQESFMSFLGPVVAALKPFVLKTAPKILKGVLEPSMRLLLSNMKSGLDTANKRDERSAAAEKDTGFGRKLTDNESIFLNNLMAQVDENAVESFLSTLTTIGDVVGSAFKKAGPVLLDVARVGLPLLLGTETESGGLPPQTHLDPLAHRAILAEACLQAYIAMPEKTGGIFGKMVKKLTKVGPKLVKASPFVARFIGPIVADVLREINNQKTKDECWNYTYGKQRSWV